MTMYEVFIEESNGFAYAYKTDDRLVLARLRERAHERAAKCLPFSQYDDKFTHLVYWYELPNKEIKVYMSPLLVDDERFDLFVDKYKPVFVGAIHRH